MEDGRREVEEQVKESDQVEKGKKKDAIVELPIIWL